MVKTGMNHKKNQLKLDIESLRNQMIIIGTREGLASHQTLEMSEKLDRYIIKY